MATSLIYRQALQAGLIRFTPPRAIGNPVRRILITGCVHETLNGTRPQHCFPHAEADAVLGKFEAGYFLNVSRHRGTDVDLEQIENVDEVWALCFRKPRPGWRLLGRFLERDTFVGLRLFDRHWLGGFKYEDRSKEVIDLWNEILGGRDAHRGSSVEQYVSGPIRDVDETD